MTDTDYVAEARMFLDHLPARIDIIASWDHDGVRRHLTAEGLRALLAEVERLRTRQVGDNHVFVSGWYAHAEACQGLGWDAREAAWRKYRKEMAATPAGATPKPRPATKQQLHERFAHPGYEYATMQGPRKAWDNADDPPEGGGWERNTDAGRDGWERFDYHEESYWRRRRPEQQPESGSAK